MTKENITAKLPLPLLGGGYDEHFVAQLPSQKIRSYIVVQIKSPSETRGILLLVNKQPSGPGHRSWFTNADDVMLTNIGHHHPQPAGAIHLG